MELIQSFKQYLFSLPAGRQDRKAVSKATVKNYVADIRHFIEWFEKQYTIFHPTLINEQHWKQFRQTRENDLSLVSLERHLSSLRKFFKFLLATKQIENNPFDIKVIEIEQEIKDPWLFQSFLEQLKKDKASPVTIKNYRSDIQQFLSWIDKNKHADIHSKRSIVPLLNEYFIEQYTLSLKEQQRFSDSSLKRKLSSIKKYITWINQQELKTYLPVAQDDELGSNYSQDVNFNQLNHEQETLPNVTQQLSEDRQSYLDSKDDTAPSAVMVMDSQNEIQQQEDTIANQSIPPLTYSYEFLHQQIDQKPYTNRIIQNKKQSRNKSAKARQYSKIPPVRLIQKIIALTTYMIDFAFVLPITKGFQQLDYAQWVAKGKPVFGKRLVAVPNIAEVSAEKLQEVYTETKEKVVLVKNDIKKKIFSFSIPESWKKRPAWYYKYHTYPLTHYLHFAILIVIMSAVGFQIYAGFFNGDRGKSVLGIATTGPPKLLSFTGRLTDKNNKPITTRTNVRFGVYNNSLASGSALLWQEVDTVTPDKNGMVSVPLGEKAYLDPNILSQGNALWLGVSVEQTDEMRPRQALPTTAYAANSQTLQGMLPITDEDATGKNVVLALDSAGNLNLKDNADHTFQASGGQFSLAGNTLLLSTNPGSSGDVQIAPDGFGQIDLQKPIHNTSNYNNIPSALGSVEVDDTFSILASNSGQSAFTLNQNGYGPLISASSSGIAKFTIENDGSITTAGNLAVHGTVDSNLTPFGNNYSLGSPVSQWKNLYVGNIYLDGTPLTQTWQENSDSIFPINQNKNLLIGLTASTSANFAVIASTGAILTQGDITLTGTSSAIGTVNNQTLQLGNGTTGAIALNPNNQTGLFVNGNNGNVDIGIQNIVEPSALHIEKKLDNTSLVVANQLGSGNIFMGQSNGQAKFVIDNNGNTVISGGSLCLTNDNTGSSCPNTKGVTPGTIYAYNTTVSSADLAENYISSDQLEPGDIVIPEDAGNNMAVKKSITEYQSQVIGVVSTNPGVTLNSEAQTDSTHPYKYPIALSGRVPVKISIENGVVKTGDLLTSSSTPGIAMKATKAGPIIGKALEDFSSTTPGKIMAYISISFGNPNVAITDNGNLNIANQLFSNLNSDQQNVVENLINEIAKGTQITLNNLSSDIFSAKNIFSDQITANTRLISPIADIAEVHSNIISPLSNTAKFAVKLTDTSLEIHNNLTGSGSAVAIIDNQGNASFSGQLASNSLNVNQDATISGTLHAGKILADQIIGLPTAATTAAQYITNVTNIYNSSASGMSNQEVGNNTANASSSSSLADNYTTPNTPINIASYSAEFNDVPSLHVNTAQIEQGLIALGPTSLSDTSITGQLSIGSQFVLGDNSINVLGNDLELQPLKQGGVSIAGRQVYIDTNGNITIQGNETINGTLATNMLAPIANHDLIAKLDNGNKDNPANFKINNASNSAIFNINQLGDIIASGAATFKKLNLSLTQQALALSPNEIIASGSAGIATVSANQTFVKIDTQMVTPKSLIYITPVGNVQQSPFLQQQVPGDSFTVGISQASLYPTSFNWLIVN